MSVVYNDSENPYVFSHGGRHYIIPPKQGGTWEEQSKDEPDENGNRTTVSRLVKVSDQPKHAFLTDVPDGAIVYLQSGLQKKKQRQQGVVLKFRADVENALEAKYAELEALQKSISAREAALADKIAATAGEPAAKKA